MNIRLLKEDEIECRVQSIKEKGLILLLYKDARCDMKILDETFGIFGWQRKHELINGNLFCTVSIYDKEKQQWIDKQDVGTESYTEKEKGQASDSFKRACFNIGVGRELYTAPFIWINDNGDIEKSKCKSTFSVKEIGYNEQREINHLVIVDNKGNERYRLRGSVKTPDTVKATGDNSNSTEMKCSSCGVDIDQRVSTFSKNKYGKELCRDCQTKEKK
ncbi:hypothetical protein [Tissierella praeacuta]|uniref:hypothetical protein n=1 Tax=Tissierella praeacuta TaxID=43131 RepID=UPI0033425501